MAVTIIRRLKHYFITKTHHHELRRYVIFKGLSNFELHLLHNYLHRRQFKAGDTVFEKEYPLEAVFFVEKGELEVCGKFSSGGRTVLKRNQFIGIIDLFYENTRSSSAKALTDLTVLALSRNDFWDLVTKNKALGIKLLTACCHFLSRHIATLVSEPEQ